MQGSFSAQRLARSLLALMMGAVAFVRPSKFFPRPAPRKKTTQHGVCNPCYWTGDPIILARMMDVNNYRGTRAKRRHRHRNKELVT